MRYKTKAIIALLLLSGCSVLKRFERSVSHLDSTASRMVQVSRTETQSREQSQGWQEFRIAGLDSLFRLPDLTIQNSPVPAVPQFIRGNDRIIYLPTQKTVETRSATLDSLMMETVRKQATERTKERTVEKEPDGRFIWLLWAALIVLAGWIAGGWYDRFKR